MQQVRAGDRGVREREGRGALRESLPHHALPGPRVRRVIRFRQLGLGQPLSTSPIVGFVNFLSSASRFTPITNPNPNCSGTADSWRHVIESLVRARQVEKALVIADQMLHEKIPVTHFLTLTYVNPNPHPNPHPNSTSNPNPISMFSLTSI